MQAQLNMTHIQGTGKLLARMQYICHQVISYSVVSFLVYVFLNKLMMSLFIEVFVVLVGAVFVLEL